MPFQNKIITQEKIARIGIFYDGRFFSQLNSYYHSHHERKSRISIPGLHEFIRHEVAQREGFDVRHCQIVDAHYFRTRFCAAAVESKDLLYKERVFEDALVQEGITIHYIPASKGREKGIDVCLALEMFELAVYGSFEVGVLIAADLDFVPLVRKLNAIGLRVMVLGWSFYSIDQNGRERDTYTAQALLDEVSYPVMMNPIIEEPSNKTDRLIEGLFVPRKELLSNVSAVPGSSSGSSESSASTSVGRIHTLKDCFGFITTNESATRLFFYRSDLENVRFQDLKVGDEVGFSMGNNERGLCAKQVRLLSGGG